MVFCLVFFLDDPYDHYKDLSCLYYPMLCLLCSPFQLSLLAYYSFLSSIRHEEQLSLMGRSLVLGICAWAKVLDHFKFWSHNSTRCKLLTKLFLHPVVNEYLCQISCQMHPKVAHYEQFIQAFSDTRWQTMASAKSLGYII